MMDTPTSQEAEMFSTEALNGHPIGVFMNQCPDPCQLVAVEFECGKCCKKACNARIVGIGGGFLSLAAFNPCPGIVIKLFGEEGVIDTEYAQCALIRLDRVCSIEVGFPANATPTCPGV
jgi:hypothetical protein